MIAVVVATSATLFARAWLQIDLQAAGLQKDYSSDLSYLLVSPILLLLLAPVVLKDKSFLFHQFRRSAISQRVILEAVLIGVLLRVTSWAKLVAGVAFGFYRSESPIVIEGPQFAFQCASVPVVVLGFLVMAFMVPIIEEVTHRAYIQSAVQHRGPIAAILVSASVFAVFHPLTNWPFSFLAGVVFGAQYWKSRSLWPSLISHATVNALIQIDWRCLNTQWNPRQADVPLWSPGIVSVVIVFAAVTGIFCLLKKHRGG
jgi:membrane protease YdiL (CAAX protease family)